MQLNSFIFESIDSSEFHTLIIRLESNEHREQMRYVIYRVFWNTL